MEVIHGDNEQLYKFEDGQTLHFQNGVVPENGVNGVQVEDVLSALLNRMMYLDNRKHDIYNEITINSIKSAYCAQKARTKDRKQRGVEGTEQD